MSENTLSVRLKHAAKTETEWKASNPVLLKGETAYSTDIRQTKTGNGTSKWTELAYDNAVPTSHSHDLSTMINNLSTATTTPTDKDYYVSQYAGGGTTNTNYFRRPMSALWSYIKSKLKTVATTGSYNDLSNKPGTGTSSAAGLTKLYTSTGTATDGTMTQAAMKNALDGKAPSSHTHNYAGSSSAGGVANSANKLATPRKINGIAFDGTKDINNVIYTTKKDYDTLVKTGTYDKSAMYVTTDEIDDMSKFNTDLLDSSTSLAKQGKYLSYSDQNGGKYLSIKNTTDNSTVGHTKLMDGESGEGMDVDADKVKTVDSKGILVEALGETTAQALIDEVAKRVIDLTGRMSTTETGLQSANDAITSLNSEASTHLKESGSENSFCAAFQSRYQYYTNVNYMLANGIYKTGKTGLNLPFESYWIIITFNTSNNLGNSSTAWITQFAISTDWSDKAIYFRRNINYTPTTWESWNRLVAS